jgi:SAM-dependent methyltransferase
MLMETEPIPLAEIAFHPLSFCDRDGRVFWWRGELYRGITPAKAMFYKEILENGIVQDLTQRNFLVDTTLTPFTLPGYPLIIKHRVVPFVSYANEWCPEMLRDTALFILDMMLELATHHLTLVGFSTWDLLFDGFRPLYVDFCTIDRADFDGNRAWHLFKDDFHTYLIYPLRLMAQGYGNLARWLLADYEHNVIHPEFAVLLGYPSLYAELNHQSPQWRSLSWRTLPAAIAPIARRGTRFLRRSLQYIGFDTERRGQDLLHDLRREVERISLPRIASPPDNTFSASLVPSSTWTLKQQTVHQVLSDLQPMTVLDLGSGHGWYSQLAASLGNQVVAIDRDDRLVATCYQRAKEQGLPILSLVMDIRYPSPGQGICNNVIAPALKRLSCDLVLALGLVHLLVFEQHLVFEQIYETLAAFSKSWVLVEFVSGTDPEVYPRWPDCPAWYTFETFRDGLRRYFQKVDLLTSHSQYRTLMLCQR